MDAGNALLAGAQLSKRFGALTVLDQVDFAVAPGEAIGIVGPNGAGKTTLLNVPSGAFPPSAGTIRIRGADVTRAGAAERCRLGVARSHQIPRPFGAMTLFENVYVAASNGAGEHGEAAYARCVDALDYAADRKPSRRDTWTARPQAARACARYGDQSSHAFA